MVVVGFVQFQRELTIRNSTQRIVDVMFSDGNWFWFISMRFCFVVAKFLLFFLRENMEIGTYVEFRIGFTYFENHVNKRLMWIE